MNLVFQLLVMIGFHSLFLPEIFLSEDSDLTLREASLAMGRHHSVIGKMEQDRRKIEILEFVNYCLVLGADPHEGLEILMQSIDQND